MKRPLHRRTSLSPALSALLLAALVPTALGACSSTPPPAPKVIAKPLPPPPPPPPPPLPAARWTEIGGETLVGPKLAEGTLVLLGGRRALVAKDGSVKSETAPSPEPLQEIIEVPLPSGGRKLIARGAIGIYRLDDPLGAPKPLARASEEMKAIGAYAGLVAVWSFGTDVPRFIDVETGRIKTLTNLPPLPMRSVVFKDMKEGAATFEGIGLAVSSDGGNTWKRVTEEVAGDALRIDSLALRDGAIVAYAYEQGPTAPVDVAAAKLGRSSSAQTPSNEPPLVKWVDATHQDPLAAAVANGVETSDGAAIVASHGLIAKVDTKTGVPIAIAEFARGYGVSKCQVSRAGRDAWIGCAISDEGREGFYDPFGMMRVSLDGGKIDPGRPALVRNGEVEMRTSPSGGVMLLGPCNSDEEGDICARQTDGRWLTLHPTADLFPRGAGPLADGRVAFLRNMWEQDVPDSERADDEEAQEDPEEGAQVAGDEDAEVPEGKRVYVAAVDESGSETKIASLSFRPSGELRVLSPIEESDDHTLHFIMADDEGVYAVVQPIGKDARKPQRLEGVASARIRGGRGIAVGEDGLRASADGGKTWQAVPLTDRVRDVLPELAGMFEDSSTFASSEVGVLIEKSVRVGWGAAESHAEHPKVMYDVVLPPISVPTPTTPETAFSCKSEAVTQGTPPLTSSSGINSLLGSPKPAQKGTRRGTSAAPTGRNGLMDVVGFFEEEGPDKPGSTPAKWTLSWHDATEIGGKPRSWSGAPPKGMNWGTQLRWAGGSGARALFAMKPGGTSKNLLVRVKAGGGIETAEVGFDLVPAGAIVFGTEKGEPIAWLRDNALVVWLSGESPRIIGYVGARTASRDLGEPTKDGIPVLLGTSSLAAVRVFPIPALDKKATSAPPPPAPTLDGWTAVTSPRPALARLMPCSAKPKGARFVLPRGYARAAMDGANGSLSYALYDVRLAGAEACVAGIVSLYTPDRSGYTPPPPPPKGAPAKGAKPPPPPAPLTFVRADFLGKRFEGGARGLPSKDAVHKLSCALEERK